MDASLPGPDCPSADTASKQSHCLDLALSLPSSQAYRHIYALSGALGYSVPTRRPGLTSPV